MADDSGKTIAEQNAARINEGDVSVEQDGQQTWVPQSQLNAGQAAENRRGTDIDKSGAIPKAEEEGTTPPESAYEQLANAQADQYLTMTKALDPLASGSAIGAADASLSQGAEAMLGTSSTSPISQWLNQQTSAAQAQYAPTAAANAGVEQAEQQGQGLIASGLQQMGQAETAEMQAAPYSQLLQSLAADVPYKILGGYGDFNLAGITGPNVEQGLKLAESNLGVATTGQTGGSTPLLPSASAAAGGGTDTTPTPGNPATPQGS